VQAGEFKNLSFSLAFLPHCLLDLADIGYPEYGLGASGVKVLSAGTAFELRIKLFETC
jgi:hypothetical protein